MTDIPLSLTNKFLLWLKVYLYCDSVVLHCVFLWGVYRYSMGDIVLTEAENYMGCRHPNNNSEKNVPPPLSYTLKVIRRDGLQNHCMNALAKNLYSVHTVKYLNCARKSNGGNQCIIGCNSFHHNSFHHKKRRNTTPNINYNGCAVLFLRHIFWACGKKWKMISWEVYGCTRVYIMHVHG